MLTDGEPSDGSHDDLYRVLWDKADHVHVSPALDRGAPTIFPSSQVDLAEVMEAGLEEVAQLFKIRQAISTKQFSSRWVSLEEHIALADAVLNYTSKLYDVLCTFLNPNEEIFNTIRCGTRSTRKAPLILPAYPADADADAPNRVSGMCEAFQTKFPATDAPKWDDLLDDLSKIQFSFSDRDHDDDVVLHPLRNNADWYIAVVGPPDDGERYMFTTSEVECTKMQRVRLMAQLCPAPPSPLVASGVGRVL